MQKNLSIELDDIYLEEINEKEKELIKLIDNVLCMEKYFKDIKGADEAKKLLKKIRCQTISTPLGEENTRLTYQVVSDLFKIVENIKSKNLVDQKAKKSIVCKHTP